MNVRAVEATHIPANVQHVKDEKKENLGTRIRGIFKKAVAKIKEKIHLKLFFKHLFYRISLGFHKFGKKMRTSASRTNTLFHRTHYKIWKKPIPIHFQKAEAQLAHFRTRYNDTETESEELVGLYKKTPYYLKAKLPAPPYYGNDFTMTRYEQFGSKMTDQGAAFCLHAPAAKKVYIALIDCEGKQVQEFPMEKNGEGNWEALLPDMKAGQRYLYKVESASGKISERLDPYSQHNAHVRRGKKLYPCSAVGSSNEHEWNDSAWMARRAEMAGKPAPMNIYEMHIDAWRKGEDKPLNYREIAHQLADHCNDLGYTHVELMGIMDHLCKESWGYLVTGYFAPNSEHGTPEDFKYLVDYLHQKGIGVFLDWVPNHFADDPHGLGTFDGTNVYGSGKRNEWGAGMFDFTKQEARDFIASSAHFWLKEMHIDGLRFDAVSNMLYQEQWHTPPKQPVVTMLRNLNTAIHSEFPGVVTMAEESSGYGGTTQPGAEGGIGFDFKWNMGWMHNTLEYFKRPLKARSSHHGELLHAIECDQDQAGIIELSHDEVAHGKKSLINKTPKLTAEERMANHRLFLSQMICLPGKKLLFMGSEFGHSEEWSGRFKDGKGLNWSGSQSQQPMLEMVRRLNRFYRTTPAFYEQDRMRDLEWVHKADTKNSVIAYRRKALDGKRFICIHNYSGNDIPNYTIPLQGGKVTEVFNSDEAAFGGKGRVNHEVKQVEAGMQLHLPPLATLILEEE